MGRNGIRMDAKLQVLCMEKMYICHVNSVSRSESNPVDEVHVCSNMIAYFTPYIMNHNSGS